MSRMRKATLLIVAMVAAAAVPAWAAFTTGLYYGPTSQGLSVSFTAYKHSVQNLHVVERGHCSNGQRSRGDQGPFHAAIVNGRFSHSSVSPSGATRVRIGGRLHGSRASGTFRVTVRFDSNGYPDPNGTVFCTTGRVHWSAKPYRGRQRLPAR